MKKIAVLTTVRNDQMFRDKWIAYYSECFGAGNLYMTIDGEDQPVPDASFGVNYRVEKYHPHDVVQGDKLRAQRNSDWAAELFSQGYEIVIATDIDEFLVVDPHVEMDLATYLSGLKFSGTLSALGLDVVENSAVERKINRAQKFLAQRRFAVISDRYTKALIINRPLRWGSGQHRVKGRNFRIDPNLFLFHFGHVDREFSMARMADSDRQDMNWTKHLMKREHLYEKVKNADAMAGDARFASARREMQLKRPVHSWNKPGAVKRDAVVRIPERFAGAV